MPCSKAAREVGRSDEFESMQMELQTSGHFMRRSISGAVGKEPSGRHSRYCYRLRSNLHRDAL